MSYNIYFSLTSIFFLLAVMWHFYTRPQFPSLSNRCFRSILVVVLADLIFDILAVITADDAMGNGFVWMAYFCNALFYALQYAVPLALCTYFYILINPGRRIEKKEYIKLALPTFFFELMLVVLLPFGLMFRISTKTGLVTGLATPTTYINGAIYLIIGCVLSIKHRSDLKENCRKPFGILIAVMGTAMLLQFSFSTILLTGTALTIGMLVFFFLIQNPEGLIDNTTQTFNYNAYNEILSEILVSGDEAHIIYIDVYGMKHINSVLGTSKGDELMKLLGKELFLENDGWFCRIAGTRFAIITTSRKTFEKSIKRFRKMTTVELPSGVASGNIQLKLVVGCMEDAHTMSEVRIITMVMDRAMDEHADCEGDQALFNVDHNLAATLLRKDELEESLKIDIVNRHGFSLVYQPIYNSERGVFCRAEALLRYEHPTLGVVSPGEFFPVVDACGLSPAVDNMVVDMVFSDIARGLFAGLGYDYVAINLTAAVFAASQTSGFIKKAKEYHIDPSMVCFEISEKVASISTIDFRSYMYSLKSAGFSFALDDFGAGHSNIAKILEMPFACVKLSSKLLNGSPSSYVELINTIKRLNLTVIAMGIEKEDQLRIARYCKVDLIQGFAYGKPVKIQELKNAPLYIKDFARNITI